MNDKELSSSLADRSAAVVHFSHHANMREGGVFPNDLQHAIANKAKWPLSCSVLWPGHSMQLCGSVGVIFKPAVESVLSVSNMDSGSWTTLDGANQSGGESLTRESFNKTFAVVGSYNEWRLKGADVVGIFVDDPRHIFVKKWLDITNPQDGSSFRTIGGTSIPISNVFDAFPDLSVFTMTGTGLVELPRPS